MVARLKLSSSQLSIIVAVFIILVNNQVFFSSVTERLDAFSGAGLGYIVTFYMLMMGILALFFIVAGQKYLLKPLLIIFLIVSCVISYFNQELGSIIDRDMVRNVFETIKDNNQQEALELLSLPLIVHVSLFGILPSIFALWVKVDYKKNIIYELLSRLAYASFIIVLVTVMIVANFKYLTYFSRENKDLRVWVTPLFPVVETKKFISSKFSNKDVPFKQLGGDARQDKVGNKRTLGIMVVGETARADHFSLNGYALKTNPRLEQEGVLSLSNATSCGTSTAFSVPCMFSFLGRGDYSPSKADKQSNTLDVLSKAGIKTVWIDNNSSCKGVCTRIETKNIRNNPDPASKYYSDGEYYDEILVDEMQPYIEANQADTLIVLHTLCSHGPSYHRRFPKGFQKFTPYCKRNSPQICPDEKVSNAYDNTIVYTDYVLSKIIEFLKQHSDQYESFLVYASDHGESLGENGVYLHGLPYMIAPKAQTHIPFIAWFSEDFEKNHQIDLNVLKSKAGQAYSHDNLSHSLLGLFNVKSEVYQKDKDIFD